MEFKNDNNLLTCKNVSKIYFQGNERIEVLRNINIDIASHAKLAIIGSSGSGKSSLLNILGTLDKPTKGDIFFDDKKITNMPMFKRARLGMGYLAQEPSIFTKLSVENNLKLVLEMTNLSKKEQKDRLEELLEEFSISHIRKSKAMMLSGGERRRTEIARSLIMNPDFILLDEPFAGIDPIAVEDIQGIVQVLKEKGIGILITDHNVRETLSITDRAYLLYDGGVLKEGTIDELRQDDEVKRLYLGSTFEM